MLRDADESFKFLVQKKQPSMHKKDGTPKTSGELIAGVTDGDNMVPAPYYFDRVAILSRNEKNYEQEIFYCAQYIEKDEAFYLKNGTAGIADVRKGPTYQAIVKRLQKARELYAKQRT